MFADYIDWRAEHPSDDLMTELLNAEFNDETGTRRRLTRDEALTYMTVIAGAGNETTTRLIGWTGKVLADHPAKERAGRGPLADSQRRSRRFLRFEPPAPHWPATSPARSRSTATLCPRGAIMMLLHGSANRDDRRFPDPDRFDIHRTMASRSASALASTSVSGRRWPAWKVGSLWMRCSTASRNGWSTGIGPSIVPTSTVRGWETLPVFVA